LRDVSSARTQLLEHGALAHLPFRRDRRESTPFDWRFEAQPALGQIGALESVVDCGLALLRALRRARRCWCGLSRVPRTRINIPDAPGNPRGVDELAQHTGAMQDGTAASRLSQIEQATRQCRQRQPALRSRIVSAYSASSGSSNQSSGKSRTRRMMTSASKRRCMPPRLSSCGAGTSLTRQRCPSASSMRTRDAVSASCSVSRSSALGDILPSTKEHVIVHPYDIFASQVFCLPSSAVRACS
jgi:hypothetical protein